jgi:cell division protein FtsN
MTKDFKQSYNSDTKEAISGIGWMISGIAIGLLAGLGMYFYNTYKVILPEDNPDNVQTAQGAQSATSNPPKEGKQPKLNDLGFEEIDPISVVIDNSRKEQTEKKRATFSYYAVLPNLELDVTVQPSKYDTQEPTQNETNKTAATEKLILKPGSYILQLASFRTISQANQAQSRLSEKSLETHIEKKVIKGKTWYRLFMGPTEDESMLSSWKTAVVKTGYQPIAVKIKHP